MKNKVINNSIIKLCKRYSEYFSGKNVLVPMFYDNPKSGGVLFIGMNPSTAGMKAGFISENTRKDMLWNNGIGIEEKVDRVISTEKIFLEKYPFFKPMKEIAECLEIKDKDFQHLDLFIYRETSQKKFLKKVIKSKKDDHIIFNDFGLDQLDIFKRMFDILSPKIILVANAKASQIFKQEYKDKLEFSDTLGSYYLNKKIPVFFSGMLTGQRAIDNHSYERLVWHIKRSIMKKC